MKDLNYKSFVYNIDIFKVISAQPLVENTEGYVTYVTVFETAVSLEEYKKNKTFSFKYFDNKPQ